MQRPHMSLLSHWSRWLDWHTIRLLIKAAIAPTIALSLYQWTPYALYFGSFGYIIATATIILTPILNRAQFTREIFKCTSVAAISAAVMAFAYFTIIKAREDGPTASAYSSNASALTAVWLVLATFPIGCIVTNPTWTLAGSGALVFSNFGLIYVTEVRTLDAAWKLWRQFTVGIFTGYAISIVVSLVIFPFTARGEYRDAVTKTADSIDEALGHCINVLEKDSDLVTLHCYKVPTNLTSRYADLQKKIGLAREEFAVSAVSSEDLDMTCSAWMKVLVPLIALGEFLESNTDLMPRPNQRTEKATDGGLLMDIMSTAYVNAALAQQKAIRHIKSYSYTRHHEKTNDNTQSVVDDLTNSMADMVESKAKLARAWTELERDQTEPEADRQGLHDVFHISYLMWAASARTLDLVIAAAEIRATQRTRPIRIHWSLVSSYLRWRPWNQSAQHRSKQKDPKHLPPSTRIQRVTSPLQKVPRFFMSEYATIAVRMTCAIMTVSIIGLIEESQAFYLKQHLVWAQYVIGIVMQTSVGQSWRKALFRLLGTILAVLLAFVAWYAGGQTAYGALIWYFIFQVGVMYIPVRYPTRSQLGFVPAFALGIVLGLVLQAKKDRSSHLAQASQQPDTPIYENGGLRLGAICFGLLVGWFWTIFPYPISDKDVFLARLAACLSKLAVLNEATFTLLDARFDQVGVHNQLSPDLEVINKLAGLCSTHYVDCVALIATLRLELHYIKFEMPIGGSFPRKQYKTVIDHIQVIVSRLQLIGLAANNLKEFAESFEPDPDLSRARKELSKLRITAEWATSVFVIMSQSIASAVPLPPHMKTPKNKWANEALEQVQSRSFDPLDNGYLTMVAVRQWSQGIRHRASELLGSVRDVIGELDLFLV